MTGSVEAVFSDSVFAIQFVGEAVKIGVFG